MVNCFMLQYRCANMQKHQKYWWTKPDKELVRTKKMYMHIHTRVNHWEIYSHNWTSYSTVCQNFCLCSNHEKGFQVLWCFSATIVEELSSAWKVAIKVQNKGGFWTRGATNYGWLLIPGILSLYTFSGYHTHPPLTVGWMIAALQCSHNMVLVDPQWWPWPRSWWGGRKYGLLWRPRFHHALPQLTGFHSGLLQQKA